MTARRQVEDKSQKTASEPTIPVVEPQTETETKTVIHGYYQHFVWLK